MMTENMGNIHVQPTKGLSRYFFLGMASIVLCVSMFMSVFTPVPLVFAIIMYGRAKGILLGLLGLGASVLLSKFIFPKELLIGLYAAGFVMALAIAEIWLRKIAPFKGILRFGMAMILLIGLGITFTTKTLNLPLRTYIVEEVKKISAQVQVDKEKILAEGGEDSRQMVDLLSNPEKMTDEFIASFPSAVFMVIFFGLWINLLIIIRSQALLFTDKPYPYSERDYLTFNVPDYVVWLVIPAFVLSIWGKELFGPWYDVAGITALKCLGLFYFFQGFGIYMDFVAYLRITGFFRSFLILFTVVTASWLIALVGLFDIWFNFRKYLTKKSNKDDQGDF